jgi:hypothetical protein
MDFLKIFSRFNRKSLSSRPDHTSEAQRRANFVDLSEEANETGDDTRIVASMIMDWVWASHDQKLNIASPLQFITRFEHRGYKPVSDLSSKELEALSPKHILICKALEEIKGQGAVGGELGYKLRVLEETGELYAGPTASMPRPV